MSDFGALKFYWLLIFVLPCHEISHVPHSWFCSFSCAYNVFDCRQPTRIDLIKIVHQMYKKDGLSEDDIASIIDTFPNQGTSPLSCCS